MMKKTQKSLQILIGQKQEEHKLLYIWYQEGLKRSFCLVVSDFCLLSSMP